MLTARRFAVTGRPAMIGARPTASLSPHEWPPAPAEYYATLPKAIAGAGAIFHDAQQRILLVKTIYGSGAWEVPGGGMDPGEYPLQTAQREIAEELGIDTPLGPLLVIDWVPPQPDGRPALVNFLFDGGRITEDWATNLQLASDATN